MLRQPNEYPDYYVVNLSTYYPESRGNSEDSNYWLGHYGRNGVYTSQASIDDHNRRVFAANNGQLREKDRW